LKILPNRTINSEPKNSASLRYSLRSILPQSHPVLSPGYGGR